MKALIVVAENFQDEEFVYPYYRLQEFSAVTVASSDGKDRFGKYGVPARVTTAFKDVTGSDFDIVIIPGGFECPDRLRIDEDCLRIISEAASAKKIIAAICHGPWVLISAHLTKGKRLTGYKAIHIDLQNSGAIVDSESSVVTDENFVTAPHYKNNPEFMAAVAKLALGQ